MRKKIFIFILSFIFTFLFLEPDGIFGVIEVIPLIALP